MTNRKAYITRIENELGSRKLIWIGTRGHDAWPLLEIRQLTEVYSVAAKLGSLSVDVDYSLEDYSGTRPDLDTYDFDRDRSGPADDLRRAILAAVTGPTAIVAYRPFALLAALAYPRRDLVRQLAMFHERQVTFEHKPWVESELRKAGVRVVPWDYRSTEDLRRSQTALSDQSELVFRFNRSDGGAGLRALRHPSDLEAGVRQVDDGFFAIAPMLEPHIALNVGGCVFKDGSYSLHGPSMQLIGIPECTRRRFGYCGNDFGAVKNLDGKILREYDLMLEKVAAWLHSQGYLGAFGVDALVFDGRVYLAEVNPRFQGSSVTSARIDQALERLDVYCAHVAAFMDMRAPPLVTLEDLVHESPTIAQIVLHCCETVAVRLLKPPQDVGGMRHELVTRANVLIQPDAILFRIVVDGSVTANGRALDEPIARYVGGCARLGVIGDADSRDDSLVQGERALWRS